MKLSEGMFTSSDGEHQVAYYIYRPEREACAAVQLSHGMCEYVENYAGFAKFLTDLGIVLAGNDHLGHGNTASSDEDIGYFGRGGVDLVIGDMQKMNLLLQKSFPDIPIILMGHSMGSLFARLYVELYGDSVSGAIFEGTVSPHFPARTGKALAKTVMKTRGDRYRSKTLDRFAFGSYGKRFENTGKFSWISRDEDIPRIFIKDCKRNFIFTASAFYDLFDVLERVSGGEWVKNYPADMPTLFVSGTADPVGYFGKGVTAIYESLAKGGATELTIKLFEDARHELHSEINKEEFFEFIYEWITTKILHRETES